MGADNTLKANTVPARAADIAASLTVSLCLCRSIAQFVMALAPEHPAIVAEDHPGWETIWMREKQEGPSFDIWKRRLQAFHKVDCEIYFKQGRDIYFKQGSNPAPATSDKDWPHQQSRL